MLKTCLICNKEFDAKVWNRSICYNDHYKICSICGNTYIDNSLVGTNRTYCYNKSCINKARNIARIKTCLEKYGTEHYMKLDEYKQKVLNSNRNNNNGILAWNSNKQKETCLRKYGVDNPWKSKEIRNKCINTAIKIYGSSNNINKTMQTVKSKYGMTSGVQFKFNETQRKILLNKENFENYIKSNYNKKSSAKHLYENLGITHSVFFRYLDLYNLRDKYPFAHVVSNEELDLKDNVEKMFNLETISSYKINRFEIDIYIPDYNLGIEFNGIKWHDKNLYLDDIKNNTCNSREMKKIKYFKNYNINIINVWEDDWINDKVKVLDDLKISIYNYINKIN